MHALRKNSTMSMFSHLADVTLVNKLVKGVLSISARFPPDNGSCMIVHTCAMVGYVFPIRLHVTLDMTRELNIKFINIMLYTSIYLSSISTIYSSVHLALPFIHLSIHS